MNYLQHVLVSLFVLFVIIEKGHALRCFECNSHNDTRCAKDNLPEDLQITCDTKDPNKRPVLCRKIKQVIDFEVNGLPPDTRVIRSCGWDDSSYKNRCYHRSGFGGRQEVCACDGDLCNGSGSFYGSVALLAISSLCALNHIVHL